MACLFRSRLSNKIHIVYFIYLAFLFRPSIVLTCVNNQLTNKDNIPRDSSSEKETRHREEKVG